MAGRTLCEGSEQAGADSSPPGAHDRCRSCGGSYRVKLDGTIVKHRPTPNWRRQDQRPLAAAEDNGQDQAADSSPGDRVALTSDHA